MVYFLLFLLLSLHSYCASIGPKNPTLIWQYKVGSPITAPIEGEDGRIYFGSEDGTLYVLKSDGALLWKYKSGGAILSSPTLDKEGNIYFVSEDGSLYALNKEGKKLWSYKPEKKYLSSLSSPILQKDILYVVGEVKECVFPINEFITKVIFTKGVYAISRDGKFLWEKVVGDGEDYCMLCGVLRNNLFLIHYQVKEQEIRSNFLALGADDGRVLWSFPLGEGEVAPFPAISAEGVYVGDCKNNLYALSVGGALLWKRELENPNPQDVLPFIFTIKKGKNIYVCAGTDLFLYTQKGELLWHKTLQGYAFSCAVDEEGKVYAPTHHKKLYIFSKDGTLLHFSSIPFEISLTSTPLITKDGKLLIPSNEGVLYAFSEKE